ncbi:MAG: phosphoribosyl-AMP cyclohydrolase [Hyphomicrobiaceae bacterium]
MTSPLPPFASPGSPHDLEHGLAFTPKFADGLVAAVATDADSGEVLMLAWMNAEALSRSIATREAHFWSRSRARIWKKGEESGNILDIVEMRTDCDQDAIWLRVRMRGQQAACHTGHRSCFYRSVALGPDATANPVLRVTAVPRVFVP